jgi:hypothetical protein
LAATAHGCDGDSIAHFESLRLSAHLDHFARELMAKDRAGPDAQSRLSSHVQIAAADSATGYPDKYLVGGGLRLGNKVNLERLIEIPEHCRLHDLTLSQMVCIAAARLRLPQGQAWHLQIRQ